MVQGRPCQDTANLHAQTLGFEQPTTGQWLEFSVEPPEIFSKNSGQLAGEDEVKNETLLNFGGRFLL